VLCILQRLIDPGLEHFGTHLHLSVLCSKPGSLVSLGLLGQFGRVGLLSGVVPVGACVFGSGQII
jgi:hypothetical protein